MSTSSTSKPVLMCCYRSGCLNRSSVSRKCLIESLMYQEIIVKFREVQRQCELYSFARALLELNGCCRDECSGPNFIFFFLARTSDLTLCKCSLESVFYSYVNNLKYLVQMLGYWDNVLVCCYFNWTNQLLFWHDNKRWRYETPNIVTYVWTSKQGRTPQPSSQNEINLTL